MRRMLLASLTVLAASGCGAENSFPTAKSTGRVTCNGKPVENVRVYFRPTIKQANQESGRVGDGVTDDDGRFTISTYGSEDGAVIGKSQVIVDSPRADDFPDFKCDCETHSNKWVTEVDVVADGENEFAVELKPRTKKKPARRKPQRPGRHSARREGSTSAGCQHTTVT